MCDSDCETCCDINSDSDCNWDRDCDIDSNFNKPATVTVKSTATSTATETETATATAKVIATATVTATVTLTVTATATMTARVAASAALTFCTYQGSFGYVTGCFYLLSQCTRIQGRIEQSAILKSILPAHPAYFWMQLTLTKTRLKTRVQITL
jgi:hypothetical protein